MTKTELFRIAEVEDARIILVDYGYDVEAVGAKYIGSNCGVYGWNWNAYLLNGVILIQGYRSFPAVAKEDASITGAFKAYRAARVKGFTREIALKRFNKHFNICLSK